MKRSRYQELSREDLQLELATSVHERECLKVAALFGEPVEKALAFTGMKIAKLQKLLLAVP
jgi:hypothetical protein